MSKVSLYLEKTLICLFILEDYFFNVEIVTVIYTEVTALCWPYVRRGPTPGVDTKLSYCPLLQLLCAYLGVRVGWMEAGPVVWSTCPRWAGLWTPAHDVQVNEGVSMARLTPLLCPALTLTALTHCRSDTSHGPHWSKKDRTKVLHVSIFQETW